MSAEDYLPDNYLEVLDAMENGVQFGSSSEVIESLARIQEDKMTDSKEQPEYLQNVKCPTCGGGMVSRKGKFGIFWGCKQYPQCTGTRDSQGRSKAEREAEKNNDSNVTRSVNKDTEDARELGKVMDGVRYHGRFNGKS